MLDARKINNFVFVLISDGCWIFEKQREIRNVNIFWLLYSLQYDRVAEKNYSTLSTDNSLDV